MDLMVAPNTVVSSAADTAPPTGTGGYATDGTPGSVPATTWAAYQYNAIVAEILAVIQAAGLTPARTNNAQLLAAIRLLAVPASTNHDVSGSRTVGTTYTNSTGKNIFVNVSMQSSVASAFTVQAVLDGSVTIAGGTSPGGTGYLSSIGFMLEPGGSYMISGPGTFSIVRWTEFY